ncbi:OprD family outer membrane porin [Sulfurospirillum arcachonense]|uniref:OprD family outer membrane porin n=1 Tax=Sulfurospirillum arcachonense TaxID=57666 RepID=UPI000469D78E|nr:OprD family outer membrane porin [Sulfurospirillum arcachonense]
MKKIRCSLAALICCSMATTSGLASDSLRDAFTNGKVTGELKAYYFDLDVDQPSRDVDLAASILVTGVKLGYKTDSYHGFKLGTTFQSSYAPFADDDAKNQFGGDMYGSGAVLSEAYLEYNLNKTNIKVGRQGIGRYTPLVRGSRSRMIEESFEGAMVTSMEVPQTVLLAGYISKFQARTTVAGNELKSIANIDSSISKFEKKIVFSNPLTIVKAVPFDGAYTLGAINKSIPNTVLVGNYVRINDVETLTNYTPSGVMAKGDIDLYYAEALYTIPMDGYRFGLDTMYVGSHMGGELNAIDLSGYYFGIRASIKDYKGFGAQIAYGTTSEDDGVIDSFGNGGMVYTGTEIGGPINEIAKDTDSYIIGLTYDFNTIGWKGFKSGIMYGYAEQDFSDIESTSYVFTANYNVPSVKGLSFELHYESMTQEQNSEDINQRDELRFRARYRF